MTDRELLELAAKAAGIEPAWGLRLTPTGQVGACGETIYRRDQCIKVAGRNWDPLEDDGDALRLAVDLRIDVYPWISKEDPASSVMARNSHGFRVTEFVSKNRGCRHVATRRAIVRAAAAIGKDMP